MSTNDYILNLLNIKDKNIKILDGKQEIKKIKGNNYKIIEGYLTYIPSYCPNCGCVNETANDIIKWGFRKNCKIKIPKISNCLSMLLLHKQRFLCKHCKNTFIAETSLVERNRNISNNTDLQISLELSIKQSEKDIAKRLGISSSTVNRKLESLSSKTILKNQFLPKIMNWDEFKATKDTTGKMAFIMLNNETGEIYDIKDCRKKDYLEKYFRKYPYYERNKVKFICIDFYPGYISLARKLFKKAEIIIDKFHIVLQAYNVLNKARIKLCYKSNPNYNKLKNYWKLILKNEEELSEKKEYSKYFKKEISSKEIVTYLVNTDETFKATYECYQGLLKAIKNKDIEKFKNIVYHSSNKISKDMKKVLELYRENFDIVTNSLKYDINNGIIEGKNNLIKVIKRISFGYRKFKHLTTRALLISNTIKG